MNDRLAALRIMALVAEFQERYGEDATRSLLRNLPGLAQFGAARLCEVDGCEERAYGLNLYCPLHRRRFQRHGDPTMRLTRGRKKR